MSCHTLLNNKLEKLIITFDNSRFGSLTGCTYQKKFCIILTLGCELTYNPVLSCKNVLELPREWQTNI